eukprot:GFUD01075963.1.p1 GENE.GFUD01075963.1~~GFUD01075963.1.p1  ORF type:complete len:162 (+),score=43.33 GFUD01075963.1:51-536(+)
MPPKARKRKALEQVAAPSENVATTTENTHWLIKSEPETRMENGIDMRFSFDDLKAETDSTACWDGVRNYSARNNMRAMKVGQQAFFYHSNTKPPGITGIVDIVKEAYVDHTQFDRKDPHFDAASKKVRQHVNHWSGQHNHHHLTAGQPQVVHGGCEVCEAH